MNFFKNQNKLVKRRIIPLKLCIATAYILVEPFPQLFFRDFYIPVLIVFGITVIWSVYLWLNK